MIVTNEPAFINRSRELSFLSDWIGERPKDILFVYGPKSSGKTTLLYKFVRENLAGNTYEIKHFNLREILITQYQDFIKTFFEIDYSKAKEDIRERREYDLKVFKLSVETLKGLEEKTLDPFAVMKRELQKFNDRGIRPVIIIDELQALEGIYLNGQRELLKELFNFFVAMTKEAHLCHVIIASSDGYFIERIYTDSKLKKTSIFLEVDYLTKDDVYYWLTNLAQESVITRYVLTDEQIEKIWQTFGGSCWEISRLLGDLLRGARDGQVPDDVLADEIRQKLIQMRSYYEEYAGLYASRQQLLSLINEAVKTKGTLKETDLVPLVQQKHYEIPALREELNNLVRQNFLAYNPVAATYTIQGRSMELGLAMYVEALKPSEEINLRHPW